MKNQDYSTDPFVAQRRRLNDIFGKDYVTANPVLVAAAVLQEELTAIRLEMTQLQIAVSDLKAL